MKVEVVYISGREAGRPAEVHIVRTDDLTDACHRIAAKLYGERCSWIVDAGLSPDPADTQYGCFGRRLNIGVTSVITGRVRISRVNGGGS